MTVRRAIRLGSAVVLAVAAPTARAEVKSADDTGFTVGGTLTAEASPAAVWAVLVQPSRWWDSAHTWSGSAANMSLDPRAGGCFCEQIPPKGSSEHLRVVRADPGKLLIMAGALGPLQTEPVTGVLTISLAAKDGKTAIDWRYAASGLRGMKGTAIAGPFDSVMKVQFSALASVAAGRGADTPR